MDPKELEKMSQIIPHGKLLYCQGSHMSMWDDQQNYMQGVIGFLKNTDAGK
jgi:proline iminopeptidase